MTVQAPSRWATDDDSVANLLTRMRIWAPLDDAALLDDVASVLDDVPPHEESTEEVAQRLRGHLMQLVNITLAGGADQRSTYAATLVQRSRSLRAEDLPDDRRGAVLHLRQMAWATGELLDQLVALNSIKEAA